MPVIPNATAAEPPRFVRPYLFHGLSLVWEGREQATGDCPFCGREGKFSVEAATGRSHCWGCVLNPDSKGGGCNPQSFLRRLWEESVSETSAADLAALTASRGLLSPEALRRWGLAKSKTTGEWLVPGWNGRGDVHQLYRWGKVLRNRKWVRQMLPTPGVHPDGRAHGFLAPVGFKPDRPEVLICEGWGDGAAAWEALGPAGRKTTSVVAVPGCGVFRGAWLSLFAGKRVTLCYDNDHPQLIQAGGVEIEKDSAALAGMKRAASIMGKAKKPPAEIRWLKWGSGPDGHDLGRPHGFDLRDALAAGGTVAARGEILAELLKQSETCPAEWKTAGAGAGEEEENAAFLHPSPCGSWEELIDAWREAMHWPAPGEGLDLALSVMLATAVSTMVVGDQLWVMAISPPSTGKTVLAEALSVSRKFVKAVSTFKGFYSGYQVDKEGSENLSLVEKLHGKAFIVKDGDTLLTLPNRQQVLGQARDLYDTIGRSSFNNKMSRDWQNIRFAWILCGTKSLRQLDHSELGQRFLTVRIMDDIDRPTEREIARRKIEQVRRNLFLVDGRADTADTKEMVRARQLTGGYLEFLRDNLAERLAKVRMPDAAALAITNYGEFVACLRARQSKLQDEEGAGREMSARLTSQLGRLALCLAVTLGKEETDAEVMARVRQVALDSAKGSTYRLLAHLNQAGAAGAEVRQLGVWANETEDKVRGFLHFLRHPAIAAVASRREENNRHRWFLTEHMRNLWKEVVSAEDSSE